MNTETAAADPQERHRILRTFDKIRQFDLAFVRGPLDGRRVLRLAAGAFGVSTAAAGTLAGLAVGGAWMLLAVVVVPVAWVSAVAVEPADGRVDLLGATVFLVAVTVGPFIMLGAVLMAWIAYEILGSFWW